jgi:hypothetical protein
MPGAPATRSIRSASKPESIPNSSGVAIGHPSVAQTAAGTGTVVGVVVTEDGRGAVEDDDDEEVAAGDEVGSVEDVAPPLESLQAPTTSARQAAARTRLDRNARRSAISTPGLRSYIIPRPAASEQRHSPFSDVTAQNAPTTSQLSQILAAQIRQF